MKILLTLTPCDFQSSVPSLNDSCGSAGRTEPPGSVSSAPGLARARRAAALPYSRSRAHASVRRLRSHRSGSGSQAPTMLPASGSVSPAAPLEQTGGRPHGPPLPPLHVHSVAGLDGDGTLVLLSNSPPHRFLPPHGLQHPRRSAELAGPPAPRPPGDGFCLRHPERQPGLGCSEGGRTPHCGPTLPSHLLPNPAATPGGLQRNHSCPRL